MGLRDPRNQAQTAYFEDHRDRQRPTKEEKIKLPKSAIISERGIILKDFHHCLRLVYHCFGAALMATSSPPLTDDIIFQHILVRLPPKSLLKFKSVSKTWLSTITHPAFIRVHLNHVKASASRTTSHILLAPLNFRSKGAEPGTCTLLREEPFEEVEIGLPKEVVDAKEHELIGSVNGLVCFSMFGGFYLWNPLIRSGKTIPPSPLGFRMIPRIYRCMGFGFDPLISDYKLIVIAHHAFPTYFFVEHLSQSIRDEDEEEEEDDVNSYMYSLNSDSWKQVQPAVKFLENFIDEVDHGVSSSGSIYWMASTIGSNPTKKIACFNLQQECFDDIVLPDYKSEEPDNGVDLTFCFTIQVIKDSIHLLMSTSERMHCYAWMLDENRVTNVKSWIKQGKVILSCLFPERPGIWLSGLTLAGGIWVVKCDCESPDYGWLFYYLRNKRLMDLKKSYSSFSFTCLTESLVGLAHSGTPSGPNHEDIVDYYRCPSLEAGQ